MPKKYTFALFTPGIIMKHLEQYIAYFFLLCKDKWQKASWRNFLCLIDIIVSLMYNMYVPALILSGKVQSDL